MMACRRLVTAAAGFYLLLTAGTAHAQTVLVRNAPPDSNVEVVLNASPVGTGKVGAAGIALIEVDLQKNVSKTETDAQIFVDVCENVRRVVIVERAFSVPSPEVGCNRRDMGGLFVVKQISTLVIDFGGPSVTLLLRQGKVSLAPPRTWDGGRTGLMLFAGGALTNVSNFPGIACGSATACSNESRGFGYTAGAEYWVTPNIAAVGSYTRPFEATTDGSGDRYEFDSTLTLETVNVGGKIGFPAGRTRIYGQVGAVWTRGLFETTQTIDPLTTEVDGVSTTVPGGTQRYNFQTRGWGWYLGGGVEVWLTGSLAVFGEFDRSVLKGAAINDQEGTLDERLTSIVAGVKVRLF
jgi:hypothetical protein